jgi:hypothetical protein
MQDHDPIASKKRRKDPCNVYVNGIYGKVHLHIFYPSVASDEISIFGDTASQPKILPANYEDGTNNPEKNILITSSSTSPTAASTAACYARGLDIAHSC